MMLYARKTVLVRSSVARGRNPGVLDHPIFSCPVAALWLLATLVILGTAPTVRAASELIPFDEPTGFGFLDPGGHGLAVNKNFDTWELAGSEFANPTPPNPTQFLFFTELVSFARCAEIGDVCSATNHIFELLHVEGLSNFTADEHSLCCLVAPGSSH